MAPLTAATVAGGTLAVPALVTAVEAAPAVTTLVGKAGAAASAGAGQAYVRGSNALARGAKAAKNSPWLLDTAKLAQDVISGYMMPPSMPTTVLEGLALGAGLLEYHEPTIRAGISKIRTAGIK